MFAGFCFRFRGELRSQGFGGLCGLAVARSAKHGRTEDARHVLQFLEASRVLEPLVEGCRRCRCVIGCADDLDGLCEGVCSSVSVFP